MSTDLRNRLVASLATVDEDKERTLEAALDLSAKLSVAGADILANAGVIRGLYAHDIPPDAITLRKLRRSIISARKALEVFDSLPLTIREPS